MATTIGKLTVRQVDTLAEGFHSDGGNLYLRVKGGSRAWVYRYKDKGRVREIGLGSVNVRKLKDVRVLAESMRKAHADGQDPADVLRAPIEPDQKTFEVNDQAGLDIHAADPPHPAHAASPWMWP